MNQSKTTSLRFTLLLGVLLILVGTYGLNSCGKAGTTSSSSAAEDTSASGAVASAVGGALSGSSSSGTQSFLPKKSNILYASLKKALNFLPEALASTACPTFKSTSTGCTTSAGTMWLSYSSCSFGTSSAAWTGTQAIIMSSGTASCGTFPNPGASGTLIRQFQTGASSTTPSTAAVTSSFGTSKTLDDASTNLSNFNSDPISTSTYINSGYGTKVTFNSSGARSAVNIAKHITGSLGTKTLFDHSINGSLTITETAAAASRTISGSVTVYHNLLKIIGTSTFNNVTHTDTCCLPTSGSITTSYAAATTANGGTGVSPTTEGLKQVGKSETLTFTGCGTATFVNSSGTSTNVSLSHCG